MLQTTYAAAYVNYCTVIEDSLFNIIRAVILILLFGMFDRVCRLRDNIKHKITYFM